MFSRKANWWSRQYVQVLHELPMTAKNNLTPEELNALNRIVVAYLELAEVQALNRQPMYMRDWLDRMDDFLRLDGRDILTHAGRISHEQVVQKV
jgi:hypothetical protein